MKQYTSIESQRGQFQSTPATIVESDGRRYGNLIVGAELGLTLSPNVRVTRASKMQSLVGRTRDEFQAGQCKIGERSSPGSI